MTDASQRQTEPAEHKEDGSNNERGRDPRLTLVENGLNVGTGVGDGAESARTASGGECSGRAAQERVVVARSAWRDGDSGRAQSRLTDPRCIIRQPCPANASGGGSMDCSTRPRPQR